MTNRDRFHRSGALVKGHYRNGFWVSAHSRSDTTALCPRRIENNLSVSWKLLEYKTTLLFPTPCWHCGRPVFFYRFESGDFAFYDDIGWNWPIHSCWELYKDNLLHLASKYLEDLNFNGRTYTQNRMKIKKKYGRISFSGIGFIELPTSQEASCKLELRSYKKASTISLLPIRFIPKEHPNEYALLHIPSKQADFFRPYSLHKLKASWVNHSNRWSCLVATTQILRVTEPLRGRARKVLTLNGRCYYCGLSLKENIAWGLDSTGNEECKHCGQMRLNLSADIFLRRIKQIAKTHNYLPI
jgi:hypothetical protein